MDGHFKQLRLKAATVKRRHGAAWVQHLDPIDLTVALHLDEQDSLRVEIVRALHAERRLDARVERDTAEWEAENRVPVHVPIGKGASMVVWLPPDLA